MKQVTVTVHQDLRRIGTSGVWLSLVHIEFPDGSTQNIVANPEAVVFDGVTYFPFGFELGSTQVDLSGGLNEVELVLQNVTREMSALVETQDLRGTRVRIITVNAARLGDVTAIVEDLEYEVNEYQVTEATCTVRLGHDQILSQRAPYGRILRDNCRWIYNYPAGRSVECGAGTRFPQQGSVSTSGLNVVGVNTHFTKRVVSGDGFWTSTQPAVRMVNVVTDDTHLTLLSAYSPNLSNAAFQIEKYSCAKTLEGPNGCRAHDNVSRIGAFPGIPVGLG